MGKISFHFSHIQFDVALYLECIVHKFHLSSQRTIGPVPGPCLVLLCLVVLQSHL